MSVTNLLAVGAAILLAAFVSLFGGHPSAQPRPLPSPPTLGAVPTNVSFSNLFNPLNPLAASLGIGTTGVATKTATSAATSTLDLSQTVIMPKAKLPVSTTNAAQVPAKSASPDASTLALDARIGLVRGALVNIICVPDNDKLHSASASGVVIDPRGIILTVAHMAQYFLLTTQPAGDGAECIIRTGSPATKAYTAGLVYISPDWIRDNTDTLIEQTPTGTGENDFALLAITGASTTAALPSSFTYIPLASSTPSVGDAVTIGSYGAEFLTSQTVRTALYPIVVFGTVGQRYTFNKDSVDLIAVDNTAAAQEGSSGGGVMDANSLLTGLITTSSSGNISTRALHAITPLHIRASFMSDTHQPLDAYLKNHSPAELVQLFSSEAQTLGTTLAQAVER